MIWEQSKKESLIHGRLDDVINIRGHRIGSAEIESTVLRLKEVSECSAISIEDDLAGLRAIFVCC